MKGQSMKSFINLTMMLLLLAFSACAVQQFPVNTETKPFDNGGKIVGECSKDLEYAESYDLHFLGMNVTNSDTGAMARELGASAYTIETKTNVWVKIISFGLLDYKIVKVIKRDR
jgi:hypothetical protein